MAILKVFGVNLPQKERVCILKALPGKERGAKGDKINISRIYDQKFSIILENMYKQVDVYNTNGDDDPKDITGYLGKTEFYRDRVILKPFQESRLLRVISKDN